MFPITAALYINVLNMPLFYLLPLYMIVIFWYDHVNIRKNMLEVSKFGGGKTI